MEATPEQAAWIQGREAERAILAPQLHEALELLDSTIEALLEMEQVIGDGDQVTQEDTPWDADWLAELNTKRDRLVRNYQQIARN